MVIEAESEKLHQAGDAGWGNARIINKPYRESAELGRETSLDQAMGYYRAPAILFGVASLPLAVEEARMNAFARSLADAQESVAGIDTRDVSSLAYVSSLVALEAVLPVVSAAEIDFSVSIIDGTAVRVELADASIESDIREAINIVASHYFQARRRNIAVSVH
jgi:hypothetical protein